MDKQKKLTLDELINRATSSERDKIQLRDFESKVLEGVITFKKAPMSQILDILDGNQDNTLRGNMEMNKEIIYKCCPMLQKKELQQAYDCHEPYDIVTKIFEDNLGEIEQACELVLSMYGLAEVANEIKNL